MAVDPEFLNQIEQAVARVIAPLAQAQASTAHAIADLARAQREMAHALETLDTRVLRQGRHAEVSFRALTNRMCTLEELLGLLTGEAGEVDRIALLEARVRELEAKLAANG